MPEPPPTGQHIHPPQRPGRFKNERDCDQLDGSTRGLFRSIRQINPKGRKIRKSKTDKAEKTGTLEFDDDDIEAQTREQKKGTSIEEILDAVIYILTCGIKNRRRRRAGQVRFVSSPQLLGPNTGSIYHRPANPEALREARLRRFSQPDLSLLHQDSDTDRPLRRVNSAPSPSR